MNGGITQADIDAAIAAATLPLQARIAQLEKNQAEGLKILPSGGKPGQVVAVGVDGVARWSWPADAAARAEHSNKPPERTAADGGGLMSQNLNQNHYTLRQTADCVRAEFFSGREDEAERIRLLVGGEEARIKPNPWGKETGENFCIVKVNLTEAQMKIGIAPPMTTGIFIGLEDEPFQAKALPYFYLTVQIGEWAVQPVGKHAADAFPFRMKANDFTEKYRPCGAEEAE